MTKKGAKKVVAVPVERSARPIRLELSDEDHARLDRCVAKMGLSKAAFARMAVLDRLADEEAKRKDR